MTTTQDAAPSDVVEQRGPQSTWGEIAFSLAGQVAGLAEHRRGDLAELRRMDPDEPDTAAFWRLMAHHDLLDRGPELEAKWGLIIHGIALMTPANNGDGNFRTAHDGSVPVGRALYIGGESQRSSALYSESRLNRLLTARGPILRTLLTRMSRMLAANGVTFDWREMARYILNEGFNEDFAELGRRRIAREYYRAERGAAQSNTQNE